MSYWAIGMTIPIALPVTNTQLEVLSLRDVDFQEDNRGFSP